MEPITEIESDIPVAEVEHFPRTPEEELTALQELVGDRELSITPIGKAGYLIARDDRQLIAEAPWALLDFDDTAAKTTQDKMDRCWPALVEIGMSESLVTFCDKLCRVDFGKAGVIYEPELEMRLVTRALELIDEADGDVDEDSIKLDLIDLRRSIVKGGELEDHPIDHDVRTIYDRTRYSSTLYPDVEETIAHIKGDEESPTNVGVLTYGDPHFQLSKTLELMDAAGELDTIFLTKVRKGDFFEALLAENPFAKMDLQYSYDETERGVGIDFKNWRIMVTLFDDDPKQVQSFNDFAAAHDIASLGVVRVRRAGAKRSDVDIEIPRGSAEVRTSDTYLDTGLFVATLNELEEVQLENFVLGLFAEHPAQSIVNSPDFPDIIKAIAEKKGKDPEEVHHDILKKAGVLDLGRLVM